MDTKVAGFNFNRLYLVQFSNLFGAFNEAYACLKIFLNIAEKK